MAPAIWLVSFGRAEAGGRGESGFRAAVGTSRRKAGLDSSLSPDSVWLGPSGFVRVRFGVLGLVPGGSASRSRTERGLVPRILKLLPRERKVSFTLRGGHTLLALYRPARSEQDDGHMRLEA